MDDTTLITLDENTREALFRIGEAIDRLAVANERIATAMEDDEVEPTPAIGFQHGQDRRKFNGMLGG